MSKIIIVVLKTADLDRVYEVLKKYAPKRKPLESATPSVVAAMWEVTEPDPQLIERIMFGDFFISRCIDTVTVEPDDDAFTVTVGD